MVTPTEDVRELFKEVIDEISQSTQELMEELWESWSNLGIEDSVKRSNIAKLVHAKKNLHHNFNYETGQKLKDMQGQVEKLKEETEECSRSLAVDISIQEKEHMKLCKYKRFLEEQLVEFREQVKQRRTRISRLLEWQRDLVDTLGPVDKQELQAVPLPTEEQLDPLTEHLEQLQAERDKRAELFWNTQIEIKEIFKKLKMKPRNKFELSVTTPLSVDFMLTDQNMDRLAKLKQDLLKQYEH